ncbi:Copper transport outer membrane protein, MctB [Pseudonocardia ammonioxydans]|uniref:Copper transport outer membrane protein, MctB n=1 Tax=Pseudonocardia ammonioxydans TaxID=260086 RepID=A0A1I4XEU8_PSUAM|nr:copper transporter [Pseudonocardia ammonioxydans]SFN24295.1 Copper transport outer membrane protein, MctB [Pseudonocardia ammonioxydans]
MISRRYHRIALVTVFVLALAAGVVIAAVGLPQRIVSGATDAAGGSGEVEQLRAERDTLAAQQRSTDEFTMRIAPELVRGKLEGVPVTVVALGADPADTRAVAELVTAAGGQVASEVELTPAVTDPARADQLRDLSAQLLPSGAQLPASSEPGTLAGGLLGAALLAPADGPAPDPQQAGAVVAGLAGGGFAAPPAGELVPGRLAVVVTGGAYDGVDAAGSAATAAGLAAELDRRGAGAVLAGRDASPHGAVGAARGSGGPLSAVDGVGTGAGRVATVLALAERNAGRTGQYGSGPGATSPVPAV